MTKKNVAKNFFKDKLELKMMKKKLQIKNSLMKMKMRWCSYNIWVAFMCSIVFLISSKIQERDENNTLETSHNETAKTFPEKRDRSWIFRFEGHCDVGTLKILRNFMIIADIWTWTFFFIYVKKGFMTINFCFHVCFCPKNNEM